MARIVVSGYMIRHPVAGNMLAYFHYVLGLHRLGHEVAYVEESGWPKACYDPIARDQVDDPRTGLRLVRALMAEHNVDIPVTYVNRESGEVFGGSWDSVKRMLGAADLLLNLGGVCWLPEFRLSRRLALVDMDPLFTQLGQFGGWLLEEHHVHFTYGVNIGQPGCTIPTGDGEWLPTVPPVVLDLWEGAKRRADTAFTTVAHWSAYGGITYNGEHYGQKDEEFLRLIDLPSRTPQKLELALSGANDEVTERFRVAGWLIREAADVSTYLPDYRSYILASRGEFSAAKNAYVKTHSGWFSDRSVCYLAAGLPAVLQDTGFSDWLPAGRGVLAFTSVEEAADCIERVNAEYSSHCRAAEEIAKRTFSYEVTLPRLLEAALDQIALPTSNSAKRAEA